MTGSGAPADTDVDGTGRRLGIVAARWHADVADALLAGAVETATERGATVEVVRVPGSFEIPVAAAALAKAGRYDGVVCLGVVVRGGTPHFDHVCRAVTDGCGRVALDYGVPVGFGVLTCDDLDQARARAGGSEGHKGRETVLAVLETVRALTSVR